MSTSRLLIHENPLQVLPSLACAIGLSEAMVLQQIHYWLGNSRHVHDGCKWVYNSVAEWQTQFPFWSETTVKRTLASLESQGLVVTANYNKDRRDRTKWYSINYDALRRLESKSEFTAHASVQVAPMEQVKISQPMNDASGQFDPTQMVSLTQPLPETTTENKNKTTHTLLLSQEGSISLKEKLIEMLQGKFACDSASELHDQVESVILNSSLDCKREAFVDERGDGMRGRVDLLVSDSLGNVCGIEIDRASPRQKSLIKLEQLPAGLVLLRDGDAERFDCGEITVINARPTGGISPEPAKKSKFDPLTQKPDNVSADVWGDWVEHRREIRHPLTPTTCKRIKSMLENHVNPDAVINLSIERGWQGLFPEKITEPAKAKSTFDTSHFTEEQRKEWVIYELLEGR